MALQKRLLLAAVSCSLLLECALGLSVDLSDIAAFDELQCDFDTFSSLRSTWLSEDEPCHQKLSFALWTVMKAEGSSPDTNAQHVQANCLLTGDVGMLELTIRETQDIGGLSEVPGGVVSRTTDATTYVGGTATTLEAICGDDNVVGATPVQAILQSQPKPSRRRLKTTTSEAGQVHEVAELIAGLESLGCTSTTGEGQTLCVLSDSFDTNGNAAALQASGDLPAVDVVKEFTDQGMDEGSAMIELAYDIASGADYKFNTAFLGAQTFADDIGVLANQEMCDVIVDDIGYFDQPSFRDGVIASAVDDAVDAGSLYFSSAGNSYTGHRFQSNFECDPAFAICNTLGGSHVFHPDRTDFSRYLFDMRTAVQTTNFLYAVNWDADLDTTDNIAMVIYDGTAESDIGPVVDNIPSGPVEYASLSSTFPSSATGLYMAIVQLGQTDNFIDADFHLTSRVGFFSGASDGSVFGHSCASKCLAVAAMDWDDASGPNGEFEDPETSPVESFSSRGPCVVGGATRENPTTCAADGLSTSTPGFSTFFGTSAAAPVAAAIATVVRAACFPKVVGHTEMLEMLTDYDYTIDYTNDAGGAPETWGVEAGHGIISASQMLAWVEANCAEACPNPAQACTSIDDCDINIGEICCPVKKVCEVPPADAGPGACGDPHMTGFRGQKFDFTGTDGGWYAVVSALPDIHLNMRVTSPVPLVPEITYITGISIKAQDANGIDHTIVITVADPHSLDSECPEGVSPCLAEGALNVELDGEIALLGPGEITLGPDVAISAVNLPGECRSFGFEKYWERKKAEYANVGRLLVSSEGMQDMSEWILGDPTATNMDECTEYVARATAAGGDVGLFSHASEHTSFQILTPVGRVRLSHGRLHQLPMRDPTDQFDLPDHLTWQMNLAVDHHDINASVARGILGETLLPTMDGTGKPIMQGMGSIRGLQEDYRVEGPHGTAFAHDIRHG